MLLLTNFPLDKYRISIKVKIKNGVYSMKNILIGFIFILLDFTLNLSNTKIDLIPDLVGYLFILSGLNEMSRESVMFNKTKPFATAMAVYSGLLFFVDLMGGSISFGGLNYILALISIVVALNISYQIVMGVIDIEGQYNRNLNGNSLKSTWTLLAIFRILAFFFMVIPLFSILCIIGAFILDICFLVAFNSSKNLYYNSVGL